MSKIKSLIVAAAVVLGSSGAAMASPGVAFRASANVSARTSAQFNTRSPSVVVRDHRTNSYEPTYQSGWTSNQDRFGQDVRVRDENAFPQYGSLGLATITLGTRNDTQRWITMPTNDAIRTVTLQVTSGRPQPGIMTVRYENGTQTDVYLPSLSRGSATVSVPRSGAIHELVFNQLPGVNSIGGTFTVTAQL